MDIIELKKKQIVAEVKARGYSMSEVARRLDKSPQNLIGGMKRLQSMHKLEELEKKIKEVI